MIVGIPTAILRGISFFSKATSFIDVSHIHWLIDNSKFLLSHKGDAIFYDFTGPKKLECHLFCRIFRWVCKFFSWRQGSYF